MSVPQNQPIPQVERPAFCEEIHLDYLDDLRESGITNPYSVAPYLSAAPYLVETFKLDIGQARAILRYWIKTCSERHAQEDAE